MKNRFRAALGNASITLFRAKTMELDTTNVVHSIVRAMGDVRVHSLVTTKDVREDAQPWIAQIGMRKMDGFAYDMFVVSHYVSTANIREFRGAEWQTEMEQCTDEEARGKIALNRVLEELYPESTITRYSWLDPASLQMYDETWEEKIKQITRAEKLMRMKSNIMVYRVLKNA